MTREEALHLLEETEQDYKQKNRIMQGLTIIAKHNDNLDLTIACEHDLLYAGAFDLVEEMTREEVIEMATLGWFEEYDSWAHHV